jgi:hypothetical protein
MKLLFASWMLLLWAMGCSGLCAQEAGAGFKKSEFYGAMAGTDAKAVDRQLKLLETAAIAEKEGYAGALLMKKAGLVSGPKNKLQLFKQGHKKLEAVLKNDSSNVELRLLRLMIQEKSPAVLGYKGELGKDEFFIRNNFKKLPPVAQQAAIDYGKGSKILHVDNL